MAHLPWTLPVITLAGGTVSATGKHDPGEQDGAGRVRPQALVFDVNETLSDT